jgi:predicted HNH restriction endonuclease
MSLKKGEYHHTLKAKEAISKNNARVWLGKHFSEETKKKMSEAKKKNPVRYWLGKHLSPEVVENLKKVNTGKKMSNETKEKISKVLIEKLKSKELREKWSEGQRGEKSHLWKGGITPQNKIIREGIEIRLWREAVFARDNWTCQKCKKRGLVLNAHHIKPFSKFQEFRFAIDNGVTLCKSCHKLIHSVKNG